MTSLIVLTHALNCRHTLLVSKQQVSGFKNITLQFNNAQTIIIIKLMYNFIILYISSGHIG